MKPIAAVLLLLSAVACTPIQTVSFHDGKLPLGSQITVHVLGLDATGLEHVTSEVLAKAGYDVRSSAAVSMVVNRSPDSDASEGIETLRRYQTPYVCRIKAGGRGEYVAFFSLQLLHVETGRILVSMRGTQGPYTAEEIAQKLRQGLGR